MSDLNKVLNTKLGKPLNNKERAVRVSFYITYAFLITTATVTFIEAMRTSDSKIRHILNLETAISVIAGYFYTQFINKIQNKELDYKEINLTRYVDWSITTPIMLLVLCLVMVYNNNTKLTAKFFLFILILNYAMLAFGYMGETNMLNKDVGWLLGFVMFFLLYGVIYKTFLAGKYVFDNQIIFWTFVVFWLFYGVFYKTDEETKNVGYNVLDLFSKCFVGLFFWAYLTKVIVIF